MRVRLSASSSKAATNSTVIVRPEGEFVPVKGNGSGGEDE